MNILSPLFPKLIWLSQISGQSADDLGNSWLLDMILSLSREHTHFEVEKDKRWTYISGQEIMSSVWPFLVPRTPGSKTKIKQPEIITYIRLVFHVSPSCKCLPRIEGVVDMGQVPCDSAPTTRNAPRPSKSQRPRVTACGQDKPKSTAHRSQYHVSQDSPGSISQVSSYFHPSASSGYMLRLSFILTNIFSVVSNTVLFHQPRFFAFCL